MVELDPEVLSVAEKWFGFSQIERARVHLTDGTQYVKDSVAIGKRGRSVIMVAVQPPIVQEFN